MFKMNEFVLESQVKENILLQHNKLFRNKSLKNTITIRDKYTKSLKNTNLQMYSISKRRRQIVRI